MIKEWIQIERQRQIDLAANLATSPDEALAAEAAKILKYRNKEYRDKTGAMCTVTFGMICVLYLWTLITQFDWVWAIATVFVFILTAFMLWRVISGMKSADDPRYDWATEYSYDAMRWKDQRRAENKLHQPMKDFKKDW